MNTPEGGDLSQLEVGSWSLATKSIQPRHVLLLRMRTGAPKGPSDLPNVIQRLVTGPGCDPSVGHVPGPESEPRLHPSKLWLLTDTP